MTDDCDEQPFRLRSAVGDLTEHERALVSFWRDLTGEADPAPDLALVQLLATLVDGKQSVTPHKGP